jgi:hypothetical protein
MNLREQWFSILLELTSFTWTKLDLLYCLFNAIVSLKILGDTKEESTSLRIFESLTALVLWTKSLYFLQLIGKISPLVQTLFKILDETKYFMVTLFIAGFAFANAFYLLGRNQIQFDQVSPDDQPLYSTVGGALSFIFMICLGEVGVIDSFVTGQ